MTERISPRKKPTASLWWLSLYRFLRNKAAVSGGVLLILMVIIAVAAPLIAPYSYYKMGSSPILLPNKTHFMGTDEFGRDVFSRVVYGARVSIFVGLVSQMFVLGMGLTIGGVAGFFGGRVDTLLMRIVDVQLTFPPMLLALLLLGTIISRSVASIIIVIGLTSWPTMARLVRAQVLTIRKRTFIEASVAYGASPSRLMFRHILPNIIGPITVQLTFGMANAIMVEAFLSFIGLGTPPPIPSWGGMLSASFPWIRVRPTLMFFPGAFLSLTLVSINLFGDGLRDALDPKSAKFSQM